ncbi:hypothetical protein [Pseudoclavibacter sp. JSM 162008]|uniref:hypothetical protein n=1 Tax=Pseudoclavibacter sp. JSM 162008 TaxID=3229855 RepID=UPI003524EBC9
MTLALAAASSSLLLTGCSPLNPPPSEVNTAATTLAEAAQEIPGVNAVTTDIREVEIKDQVVRDVWEITVRVDAESPDTIETLQNDLGAAFSPADLGAATLNLRLNFPATDSGASVSLRQLDDYAAAAAASMRTVHGITSVSQSEFDTGLDLMATPRLDVHEAVSSARQLGIPHLPEDAVVATTWVATRDLPDTTVVATADWPSSGLLDAISTLREDPTVTSISAAPPSEHTVYPRITIESTDPATAVATLQAVSEPRSDFYPTRFEITSPDGTGTSGELTND